MAEADYSQQGYGFKRKKKKKNHFVKKARYRFEKGKRLNEEVACETEQYLLHVLEMNMDDFSSPDERDIYLGNVFEEMAGEEVNLSCTRVGSSAVEKLLPFANEKILLRFTHAFSMQMREIFHDRYGSHVFQQLIAVVSDHVQGKAGGGTLVARLKAWFIQVGQFAVNNSEEFARDPYASHVLHTILLCLSGQHPDLGTRKRVQQIQQVPKEKEQPMARQPDSELCAVVETCGKLVLHWPHLTESVLEPLTSVVLQGLLGALLVACKGLCQQLLCRLLEPFTVPHSNGGTMEALPKVLQSEPATRLLDTIIAVADSDIHTKLYTCCFSGRLKQMAVAPYANFCVQNMFQHCSDKEQFEAMFDELVKHLDAVLVRGYGGVVLALAQGCLRHSTRQGAFLKHMGEALHCPEAQLEWLAVLLVQLRPHEAVQRDPKLRVALHGSLTIQAALAFQRPIKVVQSLLAMDPVQLEALVCDARGSHIVDAFTRSSTVGEKSRERLLLRLKGAYVRMALSTHGSRALEALYSTVSLKLQKMILEELAKSEALVVSRRCGNILADKFFLSVFKRNPSDWEQIQSQNSRKRKLFADIIGDTT